MLNALVGMLIGATAAKSGRFIVQSAGLTIAGVTAAAVTKSQ